MNIALGPKKRLHQMYLKYTMLNSEMQSTTPLSRTSAKCQMEVPQLLCLSYLKQYYFEDQVAWWKQAPASQLPIHGKTLLNSEHKEVQLFLP